MGTAAASMAEHGGTEMQWRTDGITPTYTTGDVFAWLLDGRIELESDLSIPLVAWTTFIPERSKSQRRLLGTFHLYDEGQRARFELWKLSDPSKNGLMIAAANDRNWVRRFIPYTEHPHNPNRVGGSPVLCALYDAALERGRARQEEDRRRRAADPLIDVLDQIKLAASQAREHLPSLVSGLVRSDVDELLVRLAIVYRATRAVPVRVPVSTTANHDRWRLHSALKGSGGPHVRCSLPVFRPGRALFGTRGVVQI